MPSQYPKLKFQTNIPVELSFPFGDCRFSDGAMPDGRQFDPSYAYRVRAKFADAQGQVTEHDLCDMRATERLQESLVNAGAGQGAVLMVCKVEGDSGKSYFNVETSVASSQPGIAVKDWNGTVLRQDSATPVAAGQVAATPPQQAPVASAAPATQSAPVAAQGGSGAPVGREALVEMNRLYFACYQEAASMFASVVENDLIEFLQVAPTAEDVRTVATTFYIDANKKGIKIGAPPTSPDSTGDDDLPF